MKTETNLTLQEILELLKKEVDIYNATNWRSKVDGIKNDEHSWYEAADIKPEGYDVMAAIQQRYKDISIN